jgi:hypothetical protein
MDTRDESTKPHFGIDTPHIKLLASFDHERVVEEMNAVNVFGEDIPLQQPGDGYYTKSYGAGAVAKLRHPEDQFDTPVYDMPYTNQLLTTFHMFRARVLGLSPKRSYSYHKDYSARIHMVVSNAGSIASTIVINDRLYSLDAGHIYWVDTREWHNAVNMSRFNRYHIVGGTYA